MKRILFILSALFFIPCGVYAQDIQAQSRITAVTVFPGQAMVTRFASVKLESGRQKVIFADIIPVFDEDSLRVSGKGNAEAKILGAEIKTELLKEEAAPEVVVIQQELEKMQDALRKANDIKRALEETREFLSSIRLFSKDQIPKDLVTRMPPAKELEDTYRFLEAKLKENYAQIVDAELELREVGKKIDLLRRKLGAVSGPTQKQKKSIVVELEVVKPGTLDLEVAYQLPGAYWKPLYDARTDFEKSEVELVSYGIVTQKTGEDWDNIDVSLSTAKPSVGGRLPYVAPWFIRPFVAAPAPTLNRFALNKARKADYSAQHVVSQFEAMESVESMDAGNAVVEAKREYAQAEEKGIAVFYRIPRKVTIKSDGSEQKIAISSQTLKSAFEYSAYPRLGNIAYLGTRVTNAKDLQLLAGRVNLFLGNDFMGESSIDIIGPQEEFDLYLGTDENVKIKREQIQKKSDETLIAGIPSPNKRIDFTYKLTVENYKNKKIKVNLFEAVPVSEDDRIKVKIGQVSLAPSKKDWKDRKGIWRWDLELASREKKEILLNYSVEFPRDMQVEGL